MWPFKKQVKEPKFEFIDVGTSKLVITTSNNIYERDYIGKVDSLYNLNDYITKSEDILDHFLKNSINVYKIDSETYIPIHSIVTIKITNSSYIIKVEV